MVKPNNLYEIISKFSDDVIYEEQRRVQERLAELNAKNDIITGILAERAIRESMSIGR